MEDLRQTDCFLPNIWMEPPCSVDLARKVLDMLARLHAHYWERVSVKPWPPTHLHPPLYRLAATVRQPAAKVWQPEARVLKLP